jgi:two-component system response regulator YesN
MMWQAVLIDDEEYVRAELAALFPWHRYQFELVGEADNALAAIDLIATLKPDLVITDIRMPEMDGLALISRLADDYPGLIIAVVSAFNDFPYVREALRLGAADYLMKAEATLETSGAFLKRIGEILEERHLARNQQEKLTSNMTLYHSLATESFWRDMLTRASDEAEIAARARQLGIILDPTQYGLIFIHVSNYQKGNEEVQTFLRSRLEEKIRGCWNCEWTWKMIDFKWGDFVVVASCGEDAPGSGASERLPEIAQQLALNAAEKWTTSASSVICSFSELPDHFKKVREVNLLRLYHHEGRFLQRDDLLKLRQAAPPEIPELLAAWERVLRSCDQDAIHDFLNHIFEAVLPVCLSPEEARWLILDFINTLRRVSFEHYVRWEEAENWEWDLPQILEQAESIHDWQTSIEKLALQYMQSTKNNIYPQAALTIQKALIFIQSNFTRDLSLEEVASQAGVSKSYLCRVFPEYTGEHFSDYLQRLRVERAKELLRFTNDHIYEIALKVGFWNSRYFSKVFHEAVGMTPADYRRVSPFPKNQVE